ncbi:hypothetical protein EMCRGX_G010659 [Ephydatia muelleri]
MYCQKFRTLITNIDWNWTSQARGNDWWDSRRSSDETNGLLPNNKLILYGEHTATHTHTDDCSVKCDEPKS